MKSINTSKQPSPTEKKSFWHRTPTSTTSSNHRSVFSENEPFSISRESFESYRRSFVREQPLKTPTATRRTSRLTKSLWADRTYPAAPLSSKPTASLPGPPSIHAPFPAYRAPPSPAAPSRDPDPNPQRKKRKRQNDSKTWAYRMNRLNLRRKRVSSRRGLESRIPQIQRVPLVIRRQPINRTLDCISPAGGGAIVGKELSWGISKGRALRGEQRALYVNDVMWYYCNELSALCF